MNYLIRWIKREYNNPDVFITENGWSDRGELEDDGRIEYLHDHLKEIQNVVINKECNLKGYISKSNVKIHCNISKYSITYYIAVWSAIDNFEWTNGYT